MMWWHDGGGGWGAGQWLAMSLSMLLFWGLLVALVVWLIRATRPEHPTHAPATPLAPPPNAAPTARAEEVLAERFARGEIDENEFNQRRAVLHATIGPKT